MHSFQLKNNFNNILEKQTKPALAARRNPPKSQGRFFYVMAFRHEKTLAIRRVLMESGDDLLSRAVSSQVPSTLKGLTSVFGMGTGGTPSLLSPEMVSSSISFAMSDFCLNDFIFHASDIFAFLSPSDFSFGSFRLPRTLTTAHFQATESFLLPSMVSENKRSTD